MNAIAEALLLWRMGYQQELEYTDRWIKWCEERNDGYGVNFHQGKHSALVNTDISLYALKKLILDQTEFKEMALEDLAKITVRASGDVNCRRCGRRYAEHPMAPEPTYEGRPFLHKGCDGELLKL